MALRIPSPWCQDRKKPGSFYFLCIAMVIYLRQTDFLRGSPSQVTGLRSSSRRLKIWSTSWQKELNSHLLNNGLVRWAWPWSSYILFWCPRPLICTSRTYVYNAYWKTLPSMSVCFTPSVQSSLFDPIFPGPDPSKCSCIVKGRKLPALFSAPPLPITFLCCYSAKVHLG